MTRFRFRVLPAPQLTDVLAASLTALRDMQIMSPLIPCHHHASLFLHARAITPDASALLIEDARADEYIGG